MGALCAVIAIIATVIPFAQGLALLGTVPMALLAYRYRLRVLVAATVAGGMITFLIAGMGSLVAVLNCAYIGGLTGFVKRQRRGAPTVVVSSFVAGVAIAGVTVAMLAVLTRLRHLIFQVMTANVNGVASFLVRIHLQAVASDVQRLFAYGLQHWVWLMLGYVIYGVMISSLIGWWVLSRLLQRMHSIPDVHKLDAPEGAGGPDDPIGPVPVRLVDVRFRYPGASQDALRETSLDLNVGEHVAVIGANGSGKTTLTLVLAGREPTSGAVHRPGAVGLGMVGGTSLVLQHPQTQVLGTRVADDVVWGLPPGTKVDVDRLLREVGLDGFAERDTGSLSGGELQRLALAAAIAREPSLLIADEFTSMIDQPGRELLLDVLSALPERHRTALVHITHFDNEAASADRTIDLSGSSDNTGMVEIAPAPVPTVTVDPSPRHPVIEVVGVGHEYNRGTPWAKTALRDITFAVAPGDGLLIHGGNGSGKSTLAWIMAGLTAPTTGACLIDGEPTHTRVGAVALSFQTARLQLMRSHVNLELASVAGFSPQDHDRVAAALEAVGLDPALGNRRIDQLSGGQMRRVVLAGLLACSPRVLILDEPLAGLDAASQRGLLRVLADHRRRGLTLVVISHDFVGLSEVCPRTIHLNKGVLETMSTAAAAGGRA
ncbi:cobalt ABC transporter ATP-binding protein [Mycobacterium arosiense ATCC BAA-1401 = DSM 45069]|uniref:Cobalt ABC transporter ATP-binding protein n=1 Tax=Mycobacterium arosiense ATCC BAA-1401 = DSM 45069 TaxID=1265311 RepID=A0A1W9Z6C3_MYCAI|nr:cobalt ABC transporter ATP-binding protein [Mycobacterium arosiense ATCC BAA-1401 = DSM 45069]